MEPDNELYYVGYRELFEKTGRAGYTDDIQKAGKFNIDDARSMTRHTCADGWPRWFIPCSALDGFKEGKLKPTSTY